MTQKFDTEVARKGGLGAAGGLGAEYRKLSRDRSQAAAAKSRTIQVITGASMASMRQPVSIGNKRKVRRRWLAWGGMGRTRGGAREVIAPGCTNIGMHEYRAACRRLPCRRPLRSASPWTATSLWPCSSPCLSASRTGPLRSCSRRRTSPPITSRCEGCRQGRRQGASLPVGLRLPLTPPPLSAPAESAAGDCGAGKARALQRPVGAHTQVHPHPRYGLLSRSRD